MMGNWEGYLPMPRKKFKPKYIGILKTVKSFFSTRWRLENKVAQLKFELQLKQSEITDLENRLEAYKDILAALSRKHQLEGMIYETDLQKISKKKEES